MAQDLQVGDKILLNNGLMSFEVEELTDTDVICRVLVGGELPTARAWPSRERFSNRSTSANRTRRISNSAWKMTSILSPVRLFPAHKDLKDIHNYLDEIGGAKDIDLIAKIENPLGR